MNRILLIVAVIIIAASSLALGHQPKKTADKSKPMGEKVAGQVKQSIVRIRKHISEGSSSASTPNAPLVNGTLQKMYMYCYSEPSAGVNTYFSEVFSVELPTSAGGHGFIVDPTAVHRIRDAFYSYLTEKGYTFKPGAGRNCDFRPDEQATKSLKHRRAYEGNPCSNCGKVVETGWRYGS